MLDEERNSPTTQECVWMYRQHEDEIPIRVVKVGYLMDCNYGHIDLNARFIGNLRRFYMGSQYLSLNEVRLDWANALQLWKFMVGFTK